MHLISKPWKSCTLYKGLIFILGMFCHLSACELNPCVKGTCNLTDSGFTCTCFSGYYGNLCNEQYNPCTEQPCDNGGICSVVNGTYYCECHTWWTGKGSYYTSQYFLFQASSFCWNNFFRFDLSLMYKV